MKKVWFLVFLVVIPLILLFQGCNGSPGANEKYDTKQKGSVTVSVLPQEYFVRRIIGDDYKINVMIPPGQSEATYEPTPREMKAVSDSILYFRIGYLDFENAWIDKIAALNKQMKIVDTSAGVSLITGAAPHSHHHEGKAAETLFNHHDQSGVDPHIWLSPAAVKIQAKNILDAFLEVEKDPERRATYETNYHAFIKDIDALQVEIETLLKPVAGKKFMVYHPAWAYFARDYGLVQFPIEIEGKSPSTAAMKEVVDTAKRENIRVIFIQQQFDAANAWAVADEINGKVISVDPLALDWLDNMRKIARTFKEALESE